MSPTKKCEIKIGSMSAAYIYDLVDEIMTAYVPAYEHNPKEAGIALTMEPQECFDRLKNILAGPGMTDEEKFGFHPIRKVTKH